MAHYRIHRLGPGAADEPRDCYGLADVLARAKEIGVGTFAVIRLFRSFGQIRESAQWGEATVEADGSVTLQPLVEVS